MLVLVLVLLVASPPCSCCGRGRRLLLLLLSSMPVLMHMKMRVSKKVKSRGSDVVPSLARRVASRRGGATIYFLFRPLPSYGTRCCLSPLLMSHTPTMPCLSLRILHKHRRV